MKKKAKVSAVNLAEFEALASKRLAKDVFEALSGGSDDEVTLKKTLQRSGAWPWFLEFSATSPIEKQIQRSWDRR